MQRYAPKELRDMTLKGLEEIGSGLGLSFTKNHNRAKRARMILDRYAEQDLEQTSPHDPPSHTVAALGEPKPEFERLLRDGDSCTTPSPDFGRPESQRGGVRPGAGRPEGMTAEICAYNRLSAQPHPAIKDLIEKLFDKWAATARCPEIRLTKEEAVALALPWTHAYELSPIGGHIPPWLSVAFMCVWSTWSIVDRKAALAREAARKRKAETTVPAEILN